MNKKAGLIILILLLAGFFRFFSLGSADVVHDESINSFRSLGYLDFFAEAGGQTTPVDWFSEVPVWTKLSFHDHPPLSFLLNGFFLNIFGPAAWAARLTSALAGLASVYLTYLIGRKLFSEKAGIFTAAFLAVNSYFVWISRVAFQESLLLAFCLASFYFFILSLENKKYYYYCAGFLALAFLTKYTAVFLIPVYLVYLFIYQKEIFREKFFYLSSAVFLLLLSPVIIYNTLLFKSRGHFDLQLSYLFGLTDKVAGWENLTGKSDLTIVTRLVNLPLELVNFLSPIFLILLLLSILAIAFRLRKNKNLILLSLVMLSLILLIGVVGPQDRFLVMFMPFFALAVAYLFSLVLVRKKAIVQSFLIVFIAFESFYCLNTFFIDQAWGKSPYTYSAYLDSSRGSWGFNQLDDYFNKEFAGKVPGIRFQLSNAYLENFVSKRYENLEGQDLNALIVYDFNIKDGPDIWYLQRRQFYQGWPLITADVFIKETTEKGADYYKNLGFNHFYFIQVTNSTLLRDVDKRSEAGKMLGDALLQAGVVPIEIKNLSGEATLLIYKFN